MHPVPVAADELSRQLAPWHTARTGRSVAELLLTLVLFAAFWMLALASLRVSYWLTLLLALPAAGFLVRLFVLQHDCGHGSFFRSRRANDLVGSILGVITLTPYRFWRKTHGIHHATSGDLDRRGTGDILTLTVREYRSLGPWRRLFYRVYRHPAVLLGMAPPFLFAVWQRFPVGLKPHWKKERESIRVTNLALLAVFLLAWLAVGPWTFLLVHGTVVFLASIAGVWLFYVQHQFEGTYWSRHEGWRYSRAAIEGSSHYDLPPILDWITGHIGLHHVHHLDSRIPSYNLRACHRKLGAELGATRLTMWSSLRCLRMRLWDEDRRRLVTHREALSCDPAA